MKATFATCAVLMLLAMSRTKENSSIQSSGVGDEISTQPSKIPSVIIGAQVWMKNNLNVSRYRNGDKIPQVKDSVKWATLTTGAWCWYNNDSATGAVYGKLYNWYAIHDPRGLAPAGWHIPSSSEWLAASTFLGTNAHNAGGKMKETGTDHWLDPNVEATNSSGFTALPGGYRSTIGQFCYINFLGLWWTSTEAGSKYAWCRRLHSYGGFIDSMSYEKQRGFSVRCVKD
ncbi:MAG TPA: fibrobacter succinogenes major paralogous domain-containing protein [Parafilimonas sp.]|nr:fibrobacter succinogenes major paralogous domain-containing protein [Parafilimonas sp.]